MESVNYFFNPNSAYDFKQTMEQFWVLAFLHFLFLSIFLLDAFSDLSKKINLFHNTQPDNKNSGAFEVSK